MHIWLRIGIFIFYLSFSSSLFGQLSFGIPTLSNVQSGDVIDVPVIVYQGFDSVEAVQFVVKWDTTVLSYLDVQNFGLPGLNASHFGFSPDNSSLLRFAYIDPNISQGDGVSVSDSTVLFRIKFRVVGATNSASTVQITEETPTTYFEVIQANGTIYNLSQVSIKTGFVPVGYNVATVAPALLSNSFLLYPQPCQHTLNISSPIDLNHNLVTLHSLDGQILWSTNVVAYAQTPFSFDFSHITRNTLLYLLIHTDQGLVYKPIVFKNE